MDNLEAIRARAKAYADHGTPGLAAPADRKVLVSALDAVLALHREVECRDEDGEPTGGTACEECKDLDDHSGERVHEVYPCMTVREISAALSGTETFTTMRDRIEAGTAK